MKKVLTLGRDLQIIHKLLEQENLNVVEKNPDVIITHGGDGYLLNAERLYPAVPKLPIRHKSICKTCIDHDTTHAIRALARGTISKSTVHKLETTIDHKTYHALNEFSLHHVKPNQAIRFSVQINDEEPTDEVIGDGVIVATPFGSHAYYRSITNSTFRLGIGIAFNNTTEPIDHLVVRDTDRITLTVLRGPAYFLTDNDASVPPMETGSTFVIKQSKATATFLGLDRFRCPDCGALESTVAETMRAR